jgi:co-chaperonin GroES (HSP10)
MNFKPFNRYIWVNPIEEEQEEQTVAIVLPENYQKQASVYLLCEVVGVSDDCKFHRHLKSGDNVVVERRMLCSIDITEKPVYLVLENYVYGRITDENNT